MVWMRAMVCGFVTAVMTAAPVLAQPEARFSFRATPGALSKDAVPLHVVLDAPAKHR